MRSWTGLAGAAVMALALLGGGLWAWQAAGDLVADWRVAGPDVAAWAVRRAAAEAEAPARAVLAEWLVQAARDNLAGEVSPPALRQSAALIRAAMRLDPTEPRFPRLLADAMEQLQDRAGQIAGWNAYRKLAPE